MGGFLVRQRTTVERDEWEGAEGGLSQGRKGSAVLDRLPKGWPYYGTIVSDSWPSFQQYLEQRFHVFASVFTSLALAFHHEPCEKSGADAGRVFEELSDVTFGLDRILMDTQ